MASFQKIAVAFAENGESHRKSFSRNLIGNDPIFTETVFSWPGVGRLIVDSMNERDIPMVTGCLVLSTLVVSIVNLIVDIAYAYLDPRIKARYTK